MVDSPLPEDDAIALSHPLRSGRHDLYAEAMRLVGARHSKAGLVELVCWLLLRVAVAEKRHMEMLVAASPDIAALQTWGPDPDKMHEFIIDHLVALQKESPRGANTTRARIVAWLRRTPVACSSTRDFIADAIDLDVYPGEQP